MIKDDDPICNDEFEIIYEYTGHHLNEMALMNSPEDDLRDIDILVYAESDDFRMKEPHFHFCKGRIGNDHKYLVDIEVKIRNIENMSILRSDTGNMTLERFRRVATNIDRVA